MWSNCTASRRQCDRFFGLNLICWLSVVQGKADVKNTAPCIPMVHTPMLTYKKGVDCLLPSGWECPKHAEQQQCNPIWEIYWERGSIVGRCGTSRLFRRIYVTCTADVVRLLRILTWLPGLNRYSTSPKPVNRCLCGRRLPSTSS